MRTPPSGTSRTGRRWTRCTTRSRPGISSSSPSAWLTAGSNWSRAPTRPSAASCSSSSPKPRSTPPRRCPRCWRASTSSTATREAVAAASCVRVRPGRKLQTLRCRQSCSSRSSCIRRTRGNSATRHGSRVSCSTSPKTGRSRRRPAGRCRPSRSPTSGLHKSHWASSSTPNPTSANHWRRRASPTFPTRSSPRWAAWPGCS